MASALDVLAKVTETAIKFIPGVAPVLAAAETVADIVGGDVGAKIKQGAGLLQEGLSAFGRQPLSPEQQVQLEQSKMTTEVELAKVGLQREQLGYQDQASARESVIKPEILSPDPIVRQARPKMMVLLGKTSVVYTILTPPFIALCAWAGLEKEMLGLLIKLILWQGLTLWGAFSASFGGYSYARSVDKKTAAGLDISSIMETLTGMGKTISE